MARTQRLEIVVCVAMSLGLANCNSSDDAPGTAPTPQKSAAKECLECLAAGFPALHLGVQLDPRFTDSDSTRVMADYVRLSRLDLDTSTVPYFVGFFGGAVQKDVMHYLEERVNYVVANTDSPESFLTTQNFDLHQFDRVVTVASNLSLGLWLTAEVNHTSSQNVQFQLNGMKHPIPDTHIGVMMLGEGYSMDDFGTLSRMSTLVHEARHSDCTGGLTAADVQLVSTANEPGASSSLMDDFIDQHRKCGQAHANCPAGHDLAGSAACDVLPWGSYTAGMMFSEALANGCRNCTSEEKTVAEADFFDSRSRLLFDVEPMENGEMGAPDMTSAGIVVGH